MNDTIETLCFGCIGQPGHYLHSRRGIDFRLESTPWGSKLDGGLLTDDYYRADTTPTGHWREHHKDGWTAVSFWDRSGDSRPGCNTTFLAKAELTGEELIELARAQWPHVFSRPGFPQLLRSET